MEYDIVHHQEKYRFEVKQDDLTAFVQYRLVGNNLDIIHTIVPGSSGRARHRRFVSESSLRLRIRESIKAAGSLLVRCCMVKKTSGICKITNLRMMIIL